jgi:hypothetical protein
MRVVRAVFVLLVVVGLALYAWHGYRRNTGRDPRLARYQALIAAYTDESTFCPTCPYCTECDTSYRKTLQPGDMVPDPEDDPGYLRGKVILVDIFNRWVMPLTPRLAPELVPARPDEVGTVIWIRNGSRGMGTYSGGARALQGTIELTVADLAVPAIVGTGTLVGPEPPPFIVGHNPGIPARPSDSEVLAYIAGLPRR